MMTHLCVEMEWIRFGDSWDRMIVSLRFRIQRKLGNGN